MYTAESSFSGSNVLRPLLVMFKAIIVILTHIISYIDFAGLAGFARKVVTKAEELIKSALVLVTSSTY